MGDTGEHDKPAQRQPTPGWSTPLECGLLIVRGYTARTVAVVAAVVGTLLSAVNEGATIVSGRFDTATAVSVVTNYLVPFVVTSVGYLAPFRRRYRDPQ